MHQVTCEHGAFGSDMRTVQSQSVFIRRRSRQRQFVAGGSRAWKATAGEIQ